MEDLILNPAAESFSLEEKKQAKKAFSKILGATCMYSLFGFCLIVIAQILISMIVGPDAMKELSQNSYYLWGLQIGCIYLIAFPLFMLMVKDIPNRKLSAEKLNIKTFAALLCIAEFFMLFGAIISQWITNLFANLTIFPIKEQTPRESITTILFLYFSLQVTVNKLNMLDSLLEIVK